MNTKPIPFELWKNANPDLVESAESCDSCHGKGFEMCNFCKGEGYTITEGDESRTATCRYCKGEGFIQCDCCKGEKTTIFQLYQAQHKRDLSLLLQIKKQESKRTMSKPQYTTVEQLIIALQAAPPDAVVIIQGDSEGNSFSPIAGVDHDALSYEPDTPVRGDVVPGDGGVKCVVLYPKA